MRILLWCSDDIVREYCTFFTTNMSEEFKKVIDRKKQLGITFFLFRKELGYKNPDITNDLIASTLRFD